MTSFNYDVKEASDVGLSCRCNLSNRQIISSVCKSVYLCKSLVTAVATVKFFNSVFFLFCFSVRLFICLCFLLLFVFCFCYFPGCFTKYSCN